MPKRVRPIPGFVTQALTDDFDRGKKSCPDHKDGQNAREKIICGAKTVAGTVCCRAVRAKGQRCQDHQENWMHFTGRRFQCYSVSSKENASSTILNIEPRLSSSCSGIKDHILPSLSIREQIKLERFYFIFCTLILPSSARAARIAFSLNAVVRMLGRT